MTIHEQAARGFALRAADYERARPSYPPGVVELLGRELDLRPGRTVLDLAAGTGKLTRLLVPSGAELVAVEPVAEMRAQLAAAVPGVRVLAGTAEAIPLPDGAVDAVTVAQAFHWFDGARALPELRRVLRPQGMLALVWNAWDEEEAPWLREVRGLVDAGRGETPYQGNARWRDAFASGTHFAPLRHERFENPQEVDPATFLARVGSISFVASLAEPERGPLLERIRTLLPPGPSVRYSYRTDVWLTSAR